VATADCGLTTDGDKPIKPTVCKECSDVVAETFLSGQGQLRNDFDDTEGCAEGQICSQKPAKF
jgi:hypothetical protein